jgi:exopolysaccharide biosynthesis polyprenyl glycosylphosphotransferase
MWLVVTGAAFALRTVVRLAWRKLMPPERAVVLGEGELANAIRRKLALFPDIHIQPVDAPGCSPLELMKEPHRLVELNLNRIIVASSAIDEKLIAELVSLCRRSRIKLSLVPPAQGIFGSAVRLAHIADLPILEYNTWDVSRSTLFLKRVLDLALSVLALLFLAPLFAAIALAIVLDSPGRVVFCQMRAGVAGRPFRMFKFRTMVVDAEAQLASLISLEELGEPVFKLQQDPRVTKIGRVLRRASLDELPQLLNVLKGDMSLVGPRPEQVELVERYTSSQCFRLAVKPGLTGPMQVYGRGFLTFEERLAVERDYIENLSVLHDLRILALTISAVITGRGAF